MGIQEKYTCWSGCNRKHLIVALFGALLADVGACTRRELTKTTRLLKGQAFISRAIQDAIEISLFRSERLALIRQPRVEGWIDTSRYLTSS